MNPRATIPLLLLLTGCELVDESFAPDVAPGSVLLGGPLPSGEPSSEPGREPALLEGRFEHDGSGLRFRGHPVRFADLQGRPFPAHAGDLSGRTALVHARLVADRLEIHAVRTTP